MYAFLVAQNYSRATGYWNGVGATRTYWKGILGVISLGCCVGWISHGLQTALNLGSSKNGLAH